jgi:4-amino-4-deoxy-L-arabinose transferase-like glycosyltransferase
MRSPTTINSNSLISIHSRALARQDVRALLALAVLFALMLIGTWQRWTQPIVDHGREMNLPARILAGEQLYVDVQFLYGPFAPYFNAFLYRVFGISLAVLKTAGAVSGALILLMIYRLSRQLMNVRQAMLATGLVLVICAIKSTANYLSPYAYAALYGLLFALASLVCTTSYLGDPRRVWLIGAGACAGFALITKPETSLAALAAAAIAIAIHSLSQRRLLWRETVFFALPVVAIAAAAYGFILTRVHWRTLIEDNHILFSNMPPQLIYFNRFISGLSEWPKSLWYTATGLGVFAVWIGLSALIGGLISYRKHDGWRGTVGRGLLLVIVGLVWWKIVLEIFRVHTDATPLTSMPIVLLLVIIVSGWRLWQALRKKMEIPQAESLLLVISAFAVISALRVILNVTASGPYAPFFLPVVILVCLYLLFQTFPRILVPSKPIRENVRLAATILIGLMIIGVGINSIYRLRTRNTYEVGTARGSFITEPPYGQPIASAIRFVQERTSPDDDLLTLPQATSINFLTDRRQPFREEIIHPGFLSDGEAIRRLESQRVPMILVVNLLTPEFRDIVFGTDYNPGLMRWIEANYSLIERFDSDYSAGARLGDKPFFILAYQRK